MRLALGFAMALGGLVPGLRAQNVEAELPAATQPAMPPAPDAPDMMRLWHNREDGVIQGRMVSLDSDAVIVRRADGRYFKVDLDTLSSEDVAWLSNQQAIATASGRSLALPFDLGFRVLKRLDSAGRVEETGEVTTMGARVTRRTPPTYAVLLQGTATKQVYWVPITQQLYGSWTEGFVVPRQSLALMLQSNEDDLVGLRTYPRPDLVVLQAQYGHDGAFTDVTYAVVLQLVGGPAFTPPSIEGTADSEAQLQLTLLTPQGPTVRTVPAGTGLGAR